MDYKNIINETTEFITKNLLETLSSEMLAQRAGFSTYHFSKLFSFYEGMPIMEYVRRARLARAAHDICAGRRIIDVALEYGFESHSGFSKAFKRVYSYSPEEYRQRVGTHRPPAPNPLVNTEKIQGESAPTVRITEREGFYIAGIILRTSPELSGASSMPAVWNSIDLSEIENRIYADAMPKEHGEYYLSFPVKGETFRYVAGVRISAVEDVDDGLYLDFVEGGLYAVFSLAPVFGSPDEFARSVSGAWKYIYESWLPTSEYRLDQTRLDYEFYDERCHGTGPYSMDIYVPITKKDI